jgi:hypothetical protein
MNKGAKRRRKKKVTPEFGGYYKRNFIPQNSWCYTCSAASVIFEKSFGLLTFGIVNLYTATQYKVKSIYKRASNR